MNTKEITLESYFGVRTLTMSEFEWDIKNIITLKGDVSEELEQIRNEFIESNNIVVVFEGEFFNCWENLKEAKDYIIMGIMKNVLFIDIDVTNYDVDEGFIERFLNVENIFELNQDQIAIYELID